ncbi:MATE family multidrug resistance protein [Prosthecobacter fusiformis]|uniref:Multidrug-efflux transporter n=1 Tax=Prosthecobacter fusiformis TaxID=48464 RepID=A0A4R7SQ69_9BACT|nr:MATE family efflux transporter [Prosthecobacter fusiformis]TDU81094.1 MATE family multidrug resistance protein [Prosthecobacter fusiformis]
MHSSLSTPSVSSTPITWPSFGQECRITLKLAVPLVSGQLSQMLMGVADTVMIGTVGVLALGASTFANTLLAVPYVLGIGLLSSVSVRVSQAHGAKAPEEARQTVRHGTWLALGLGLLVVLGTVALIPMLPHFQQPAEVVELAPVYLLTCAISLIPALMMMVWKNHADALNKPWPPFCIMVGSVLLNVLLNWLWIEGHAGFPAMGLEGAGYATLTARIIGALALFIWLNRSPTVREWSPVRWLVRTQMQGFSSLLKIGLPASFHLLAEVTAFVMASLMIGSLGVIPLAAHQVAITCIATAFMVPLGVAMATTVRVGEIVGANQRARLHRVLVGSWLFATLFMSVSMGVFFIWGQPLAAQFVNDAGVIEAAAALLVVGSLFQLFDGLQVVSAAALRGVDDVKVPAWIAVLAYWTISLPLGWLLGLQMGWGATGIWAALAVGLAIAAVMLMWRAWRLLGVYNGKI